MAIGLNDEKQIGSIFSSARSTAPTGYLLCNGSAISRTVYKNLFDAIGVTYGNGDGSTTFNIPDLVGAVPRGAGTSNGYTQNVTLTLGAKNNDTMQGHRHSLNNSFFGPASNLSGNYTTANGQYAIPYISVMNPTTDTLNGTPRVGNETQTKNQVVNFFIKF